MHLISRRQNNATHSIRKIKKNNNNKKKTLKKKARNIQGNAGKIKHKTFALQRPQEEMRQKMVRKLLDKIMAKIFEN